MRRVFLILGALVLLFLSVQAVRMYFSGNTIPNYNYLGLDGKFYTNQRLPKTPIIFVYFSPKCGYCEKTMAELFKLRKRNSEVDFVLITNEKDNLEIKKFVEENNINDLTSLVYIDIDDSFPNDFGLGMVYTTPTILVYDRLGKFEKEINYKDIESLKL